MGLKTKAIYNTDMSFTLFFDGCSKGNPGVAGCGAVIYNSSGEEIWSIAKYVGDKCMQQLFRIYGTYLWSRRSQ